MKHRIGYGGPRQYRHGQRFPGGRRYNGGMTEAERLVQLMASMQVLFGSRRGFLVIPLLLIGLAVGGWFLYQMTLSPERALERAHKLYRSMETREKMAGIQQYEDLLEKSDPLNPGQHWLTTDRDTLYRRIIQHRVKYMDSDQAYEWVLKAWEDGYVNLRFQDEEVEQFWEESVATLRKNSSRDKNRIPVPSDSR